MKSSFVSKINTIRKFIIENKLFSMILVLSFSSLFLLMVLDKKPFNYIYNGLLILIMLISFGSIIINILRDLNNLQKIIPNIIIFIVILLVFGTHSLIFQDFNIAPYVNICIFFLPFTYFSFLSIRKKELLLYSVFLAVLMYVFITFIFYFKDIVHFFDIKHRIGAEFGNQDRFAIPFSMYFIFLFYFLEKRKFLVLIPILFILPLLFLCQTRTPLIILLLCFIRYIYQLLKEMNKTNLFWFSMLSVAIIFIGIIIFIPLDFPLLGRMKTMFFALFTGKGDDSVVERFQLLSRSYLYGITHLFNGVGFSNVLSVVSNASHDFFGEVAFSYGGLFAIFFSGLLLFLSYKGMKKNPRFGSYFLIYNFVYFFTGVYLSSRMMPLFIAICFSCSLSECDNVNSFGLKFMEGYYVLNI